MLSAMGSPNSMNNDSTAAPTHVVSSQTKKHALSSTLSSSAIPKIQLRRAPLLLISYVITITVVLQSQMNSSSPNDVPFLTHLDLLGNGNSNVGGGDASCSQRTFRTLANLIAKINENTHANALIPLDVTLDDATVNNGRTHATNVTMPGLHLSSFRGKRIAFLGDSTIFYMAKYLVSMLRHEDKSIAGGMGKVEYHTMNSGRGNSVVLSNKQFALEGTTAPPPFRKDDENTWFQFWGMSGNSHGRTEELLDAMFTESEVMRPQVVVANMAFHWFHLCGYSEKMCPTPIDSPIIVRWLNYKETWLQRVYDFAVKVDAKVLLFKTANFICGSARTGDWATGDAIYQSFDNKTISECARRLEPLGKEVFVGPEDVAKYCKYGQFTDVGSRYVNDQMVEFVRQIQERDNLEGGGRLTVGIYNDHDIESCSTTVDAIHHKKGIVMRLRLLANTIDSYMKCSNG